MLIHFGFPRSALPPELGWNVGLNYGLSVELLGTFLSGLHGLMLLEVLDVLWVCQVLELGVLVVVPMAVSLRSAYRHTKKKKIERERGGQRERENHLLLPMVNLILVLIIAVMAGPGAHIGKGLALDINKAHELFAADATVTVAINHVENLPRNAIAPLLRHVLVGLVHQAVRALDLVRLPDAVAIEVVQREEGRCVERARVVLLCVIR